MSGQPESNMAIEAEIRERIASEIEMERDNLPVIRDNDDTRQAMTLSAMIARAGLAN